MTRLFFAATISLSIVFASCENKSTEELSEAGVSDNSSIDTTPVTVNLETKFKFDFAIANIPSPVSSVSEISKWGVAYNNTLLFDRKDNLAIKDEFNKAVILGIYGIDMSYAIFNNSGEDVLKFMKTVIVTSESLGLKSAIDQMTGKRAEKNLSNKDSLLTILESIFVKSDSYLRTNDRVYTASIVFAGSWIESLYLTCKVTESVTDTKIKEKAYKHLWQQRFYLKSLTDLLNDYGSKKECVALNVELKKIHDIVNAIENPQNLKEADFKTISGKIYALRNSFTN